MDNKQQLLFYLTFIFMVSGAEDVSLNIIWGIPWLVQPLPLFFCVEQLFKNKHLYSISPGYLLDFL
jgi:hypothetical protein